MNDQCLETVTASFNSSLYMQNFIDTKEVEQSRYVNAGIVRADYLYLFRRSAADLLIDLLLLALTWMLFLPFSNDITQNELIIILH